ncbi:MAG TPA: hypothetical protein VFH06_02440 [Candidatus Saccharimonadales bacterium]|nr:hypothetical protein [Candidatus Saccharimonadales bacterium]
MAVGAEDRQLDFLPVCSQLDGCRLECAAYLAKRLEQFTNNRLTVRALSGAAITVSPGGLDNLFLAVCAASTPPGPITVLADEMMPYIISPDKGIGCSRI